MVNTAETSFKAIGVGRIILVSRNFAAAGGISRGSSSKSLVFRGEGPGRPMEGAEGGPQGLQSDHSWELMKDEESFGDKAANVVNGEPCIGTGWRR